MSKKAVGISNRETPEQEEQERAKFPPIDPGPPPPEDAGGSVGEASTTGPGAQTSDNNDNTSLPSTRKVSGAYGREGQPGARDRAGSSHPARPRSEE